MSDETKLGKLPLLISIFGTMILSLSIVYDYGFFITLGTSFSEMPTTLSDQLRSSLTWIPSVFIGFFVVFTLELFFRRMEHGMTEQELIESSPNPKFTARFRKSPRYLIIVIALFPLLTLFFDITVPLSVWVLTVIVFWFLLHDFLFGHESIIKQTSKEFYTLTRWAPAILIFIAFQGAIAAERIKKGGGNTYVLKLENTEIKSTLVRTFDKYYLLWNKDKQDIFLIRADKVIMLYPVKIQQKPIKNKSPIKSND